jgi:hypothetical protein
VALLARLAVQAAQVHLILILEVQSLMQVVVAVVLVTAQ